MKFEALNMNGEVVIGTGVAESNEDWRNWNTVENIKDKSYENFARTYGDSLSYLFNEKIDWIDGVEFNANNFEIVWTSTIKIIK